MRRESLQQNHRELTEFAISKSYPSPRFFSKKKKKKNPTLLHRVRARVHTRMHPTYSMLAGASCSSAVASTSSSASSSSRCKLAARGPVVGNAGKNANASVTRKKSGAMSGAPRGVRQRSSVVVRAEDGEGKSLMARADELLEKVGLSLGPIGMTLGAGSTKKESNDKSDDKKKDNDGASESASLMERADEVLENAGLSLGPIGMTLGAGASSSSSSSAASADVEDGEGNKSIAPVTTEEWKAKFVNERGAVDLFMEDHYNAPSRMAGGAEFASLTNVENIAWSGLPTDALTVGGCTAVECSWTLRLKAPGFNP
jgi:hypothetical protein